MAEQQHLKTKICIIGAGPAGATASLYLSRFSIPHLVVDKADFPRDKVCGESFDGRVYRILEDLSPHFLPELRREGLLLATWNYTFRSKRIDLEVAFPKDNLPRLSADRKQLDHFLYSQLEHSAPTRLLKGVRIRKMDRLEKTWCLLGDNIRIDAELVVMAGGAGTPRKNSPHLFVFSRQYYQDLPMTGEKGLEVYYFDRPVRGCLFICPLSQQRCNVEVAVQREAYTRSGLTMDAIKQAYLSVEPALEARFRSAKPMGSTKGTSMLLQSKVHWADDGLLQIGSSAFCINPITGLGVGNAMTTGRLAAECIRDHLADPDFSTVIADCYRRSAQKKFRSMLLLNRLLNFTLRHFSRMEPVLALFLRTSLIHKLLIRRNLLKEFTSWDFYRQVVFRR